MEWTTAETATVAAVVLVAAAALIGSVLLTRGLIKAGQSPAPSMLVVSVSLLSLTALVGGLAFSEDSAVALAGAGIGALAGAVSSIFGNRDCPPGDPPEEQESHHAP